MNDITPVSLSKQALETERLSISNQREILAKLLQTTFFLEVVGRLNKMIYFEWSSEIYKCKSWDEILSQLFWDIFMPDTYMEDDFDFLLWKTLPQKHNWGSVLSGSLLLYHNYYRKYQSLCKH